MVNSEGYPDLRGMMTWSINWDAANCCGAYTFAQNYRDLFIPQIINGINHNDINHSFYLYPNPANDYLIVKLPNDTPDYKWITVTDLNGKVVKTTFTNFIQPIEVGDLTNGIYVLTIDQNKSMKFVINR